jgi:deazaflavin-dependent oxidoreductase (nitroreductase family)
MRNIFVKWFMSINTFIIRLSRGRVGSQLGTQTILILHTTGRKSGQRRSVPIAYFRDGESFFIVASNWGKDTNADWYFNLQADPRAELELDGRQIAVTAQDAQGDEYARLWKYAAEHNPPYLDYQKMTTRPIPIVVFTPIV